MGEKARRLMVVVYATGRPPVPADQLEKYILLPDVTPIVVGFDPRTESEGCGEGDRADP